MEPRKRKIAAAATGAVLGIPAAVGAVPVLGIIGGIAATVAVVAGGAVGFMLMVPASRTELPFWRVNPEVMASLGAITAASEDILQPEVEAAIRNSAQSLLLIAKTPDATVTDISFVILNMESLLGLAEAWKRTEASVADRSSADTLAASTIATITDVTRNARHRYEVLRKQSRDSLQIELAVTRRIIDEDRKGMQP
jgi:hypothetical protein